MTLYFLNTRYEYKPLNKNNIHSKFNKFIKHNNKLIEYHFLIIFVLEETTSRFHVNCKIIIKSYLMKLFKTNYRERNSSTNNGKNIC